MLSSRLNMVEFSSIYQIKCCHHRPTISVADLFYNEVDANNLVVLSEWFSLKNNTLLSQAPTTTCNKFFGADNHFNIVESCCSYYKGSFTEVCLPKNTSSQQIVKSSLHLIQKLRRIFHLLYVETISFSFLISVTLKQWDLCNTETMGLKPK